MNIRRQEKNDCSGIAHVVTLAWNEAYKDMVSRDFLDNLYVTEHDRADEAYKKFNKRYFVKGKLSLWKFDIDNMDK